MNSIQRISRDIETRRLKLQMGLDPNIDIDNVTVRTVWREPNLEQVKNKLSQQFNAGGLAEVPAEPAFFPSK